MLFAINDSEGKTFCGMKRFRGSYGISFPVQIASNNLQSGNSWFRIEVLGYVRAHHDRRKSLPYFRTFNV